MVFHKLATADLLPIIYTVGHCTYIVTKYIMINLLDSEIRQ